MNENSYLMINLQVHTYKLFGFCIHCKNDLVKFTIISITTVVVKPLLSDVH